MQVSKKPVIQSVTVSHDIADDATLGRVIAWDRPEREPCQAGTPGCAIDHTAEATQGGCEPW